MSRFAQCSTSLPSAMRWIETPDDPVPFGDQLVDLMLHVGEPLPQHGEGGLEWRRAADVLRHPRQLWRVIEVVGRDHLVDDRLVALVVLREQAPDQFLVLFQGHAGVSFPRSRTTWMGPRQMRPTG